MRAWYRVDEDTFAKIGGQMAELSGEHLLVTGGAGFIGSHLVSRLLERGAWVTVFDNFSTGKRENLAHLAHFSSLRIREVDITQALWPSLLAVQQEHPLTRIVHLAAQVSVVHSIKEPLADIESNQKTTLHLLEFAKLAGIQKVVFPSSAAVYGELEAKQIREDMPREPLSPYGLNKLASEGWLRYYAKIHRVPTVALRFFNVYGPRQDPHSAYSGVISRFLERALYGESLVIFGDGRQTRDFVYVEDIVQALLLASFGPVCKGEAINIGTGRSVTISRIAELIIALCESPSAIRYVEARSGEIRQSCAEIAMAQHLLGYHPAVLVEEGLSRTLRWMQEQRAEL